MVAAGCSSSTNGSTANSGSSNTSTQSDSAATAVKKAEAYAQKYYNVNISVPVPTQAFTPGKHKLMVISPSQTVSTYVVLVNEAVAAGKAMGWQVSPVCDSKGSPQTGGACIVQGIQQGDNAILYIGAPVTSLEAPIAEAIAKGVQFGTNAGGFSTASSPNSQIVLSSNNYFTMGAVLAAETIIKIHGKGKIAYFNDPTFGSTIEAAQGFSNYVRANCPDCTLENKVSPLADVINYPVPPAWAALLSSNPPGTIAAAIAPYGAAATPFAKAEINAGRSDIPILTEGPLDGPSVQLIKSGSPLVVSLSLPEEYQYWALVDLLGRKVAGVPLWNGTNLPFAVIDKGNAGDLTGDGFDIIPANNFKAEFEQLWGTS
jgi:ABC-type sugar transport system substrate-binding protein